MLARRRQHLGARRECLSAARQRCNFYCKRIMVRGFQMRGIAVVPAAVQTPNVTHDKFGLVIQRPQIRQLQGFLRHFHAVQNVVELCAAVHHGQGISHEVLQRGGDITQHSANALAASDR